MLVVCPSTPSPTTGTVPKQTSVMSSYAFPHMSGFRERRKQIKVLDCRYELCNLHFYKEGSVKEICDHNILCNRFLFYCF